MWVCVGAPECVKVCVCGVRPGAGQLAVALSGQETPGCLMDWAHLVAAQGVYGRGEGADSNCSSARCGNRGLGGNGPFGT